MKVSWSMISEKIIFVGDNIMQSAVQFHRMIYIDNM